LFESTGRTFSNEIAFVGKSVVGSSASRLPTTSVDPATDTFWKSEDTCKTFFHFLTYLLNLVFTLLQKLDSATTRFGKLPDNTTVKTSSLNSERAQKRFGPFAMSTKEFNRN
jgi:hypothetical protein